MSKIVKHVTVYDRKSGNLYYADEVEIDHPFITLRSPLKHKRDGVDVHYFDKETNTTRYKYVVQNFYVKVNDFMHPTDLVTINIIPKEEKLEWATVTEEEAEGILQGKKEEAQIKLKEEQEAYYVGLPKMSLERIWYFLFKKK